MRKFGREKIKFKNSVGNDPKNIHSNKKDFLIKRQRKGYLILKQKGIL